MCASPSAASVRNQTSHHRAEQAADALGPVALEEEQGGEHDQRHRHDPGVQARGRDLQALDRRQHRDGRRDDAVAEEDGGAEDAEEEQAPAQLRAIAHRLRGERQHGDEAAFAVVVGAQDQHHVLDRDDDRQRPEDEREDAVDVALGERHMAVREHLLQGVERTGADVAVDDAEGTERQREQAGSGAVLVHARADRDARGAAAAGRVGYCACGAATQRAPPSRPSTRRSRRRGR